MAENTDSKINFWKFCRDVWIEAIAKGQLPIAIWGTILLLLIFKMPGKDSAYIASKLIDMMVSSAMTVYLIIIAICIAIIGLLSWQLSFIKKELERVTKERNSLQERCLGGTLESSTR
jgi:hypothetical protein